jgi:hypothetical protein
MTKLYNNKNTLVFYFDFFLFNLVIFFLFYDILLLLNHLLEIFNNGDVNSNIICNMSSNVNNVQPTSGSNTNTTIIHSNDGWAQGIKSIFIYGTGVLRLHLLRGGGTPFQRGFVIASTFAADAAATALKNSINDPEYVEKHINSWSRIFKGNNNSTLELNVDKDTETLGTLKDIKDKFISDDMNSISEKIINSLLDILKPILEPVSVNYSNEILANQIYGISIILFILSVLILILLIAFMINILILVYSDKLLNLFNNKYIRWYIAFNKKIIGIEICFLGGSILYFMFQLSLGIHFIATHPIKIS